MALSLQWNSVYCHRLHERLLVSFKGSTRNQEWPFICTPYIDIRQPSLLSHVASQYLLQEWKAVRYNTIIQKIQRQKLNRWIFFYICAPHFLYKLKDSIIKSGTRVTTTQPNKPNTSRPPPTIDPTDPIQAAKHVYICVVVISHKYKG